MPRSPRTAAIDALAALALAATDAAASGDAGLRAMVEIDRARALVDAGPRRRGRGARSPRRARSTPQSPLAWLLSATLARRLGKLDEAQGFIETAAALSPDYPEIGLEAGVIAMLQGREDAAEASWRSVIALAPGSAAADNRARLSRAAAELAARSRGRMIPLSVLDLVPIREGGGARRGACTRPASSPRRRKQAGYKRFWVAEHHATRGVAGGAAAVVLAHIGHATSTIRIGSGGIMLPNHNPFVIAEQFGTLDGLFPGRVDLGLGRAPGAGRDRRPGAAQEPAPGGRVLPAGRGRAARAADRRRRAADRRHARARRQGRAVDARLEPVRRPARGAARAALRVRQPLRARPPRRRAGRLPQPVPALAPRSTSRTRWRR